MLSTITFVTLMSILELPAPSDRAPVALDHFPTPVHAFVWRNWQLVPATRMAAVVEAAPEDIVRMGEAMGLGDPPTISSDIRKRAYISIIRRNWHLLPYSQLTALLDMTERELAFTLREDDFLYVKLGRLKPSCPELRFAPPTPAIREREAEIRGNLERAFPDGAVSTSERLFQFVEDLSSPFQFDGSTAATTSNPRFCSSYFALFGDPLSDNAIDPYPDGYLDRLAASGVNGVWMHVVLYRLAPFPWDPALSEGFETRLARLEALAKRAADHGIGIYLYLNEPRAMPAAFFEERSDLRGVTEGEHSALCTSAPEVRDYLVRSVERICRAAPSVRGVFTITASENLTNCWSHHRGHECVRCRERSPAETVADVNAAVSEGIRNSGADVELIAWDWGWRDEWALAAIDGLPDDAALMSVSEWSIPITRGGVDSVIGEYSMSTVGPGPRATKHWTAARQRGLKTIAKIQAGNTWELAAIPYIPALENVAQHASNLRETAIDGMMLGWSLGGYPSPNLEVVAEIVDAADSISPREAMMNVATSRYGPNDAAAVVAAWTTCSEALREFPFDGSVVYRAPIQAGPSNLLWASPTGYASTMVGIPYDDLDGWRGRFPVNVFIGQFTKMADGFESALRDLKASSESPSDALLDELNVIEAAAIHYRSVALQARFVELRRRLDAGASKTLVDELADVIRRERQLAIRLHAIQTHDSRIGYEASNHYFYVPADLAEKVLNCDYLLAHWIPTLRE